MNQLNLFLCTEVTNSGVLARIGNFGLQPVRHLFKGRSYTLVSDTLRLTNNSDNARRPMIKTVIAIILLMPGLLIAIIFKLPSYLYAENRNTHRLIAGAIRLETPQRNADVQPPERKNDVVRSRERKEALNESFVKIEIGSENNPISNEDEFEKSWKEISSNSNLATPTALIIYGTPNLKISKNIFPLKTLNTLKRLILVGGATIVEYPGELSHEYLARCLIIYRWEQSGSFLSHRTVSTVDQALQLKMPNPSKLLIYVQSENQAEIEGAKLPL